MAWHITKDNVDGGKNIGQWNANFKKPTSGLHTCIKICNSKFRLLDDDGEVYYEGYSNDSDSEKAFSPLDDFGRPNAGCTEIQYLENGKWETP